MTLHSKNQKHANLYRDVFGGWRWEAVDADGVASDSPLSYQTREECAQAALAAGLSVGPAFLDGADAALSDEPLRSIFCASADEAIRGFFLEALRGFHTVIAKTGYESQRAINDC